MLFDQGVPQPLRRELAGHVVDTVYERGWSTLSNGVLLATAEQAGYDVFISNLRRGYPRLSLQGGSAVSFHVVSCFVYRRACGNLRLWSGAENHGPNERVRPPQGIWTAVLGPGIP